MIHLSILLAIEARVLQRIVLVHRWGTPVAWCWRAERPHMGADDREDGSDLPLRGLDPVAKGRRVSIALLSDRLVQQAPFGLTRGQKPTGVLKR